MHSKHSAQGKIYYKIKNDLSEKTLLILFETGFFMEQLSLLEIYVT